MTQPLSVVVAGVSVVNAVKVATEMVDADLVGAIARAIRPE